MSLWSSASRMTILLAVVATAHVSSAASTSAPVNCDSVKYTFTDKPLNEDYHKEAFNRDVLGVGRRGEPSDAGHSKSSPDSKKADLTDEPRKTDAPVGQSGNRTSAMKTSPINEIEKEAEKVLKSEAYARLWATADLSLGMDYVHIVFSVRDLALYVVFLILLHFLTFGAPDPTYNYYSLIVQDILTKTKFFSKIGDGEVITSFYSVRSLPQVWDYISQVFLNFIYESERLVTNSKLQTVLIDNILVGAPALEMKRVKNDTCLTSSVFQDVYKTCYDYYHDDVEDTDSFGKGHPWEYTSPHRHEVPTHCQAGVYGGGGFYMNFSADRKVTEFWLRELREMAWIRAGTRFVSIDFILYSHSANLFLYPRLNFEFLPTGGVLPSVNIFTLKLFRYYSKWDYFSLSCDLCFIGFVLYYSFEEIHQNAILGRKYYSNFWNGLDLTVLAFSYYLIGTGIVRVIASMNVHQKLEAVTTMQHEELSLIAYWQNTFDTACALTYFFALVKLCKFFSLTRFVDLSLRSFKNVASEIGIMVFLTISVTLGFSVMGMVLFGDRLLVFSRFRHAFFAIFGVNVGVFKYHREASKVHKYLAPLFFGFYILLVTLCFMTYFIALVVHGYSMTLKHGEGLKKITLEDLIRAYLFKFANFFKRDALVRKYTAKLIMNIHKADYDEFVAILRRHHIDGLHLKLMMRVFEIRRGDALTADGLAAVYNDFWLRKQLFFEVEAHFQIQKDLQDIERLTIAAEQTLRDMQFKLDFLADEVLSSWTIR